MMFELPDYYPNIDVTDIVWSRYNYVDWNEYKRNYSFHRGGITLNNGEYFLFGVDNEYGSLVDIGGGIKRNEDLRYGALREFREEFNGMIYNLFDNNPDVVMIKNIFSIIPKVNLNKNKVVKEFKIRRAKAVEKVNCELSDVLWLNRNQIMNRLREFYGASRVVAYAIANRYSY